MRTIIHKHRATRGLFHAVINARERRSKAGILSLLRSQNQGAASSPSPFFPTTATPDAVEREALPLLRPFQCPYGFEKQARNNNAERISGRRPKNRWPSVLFFYFPFSSPWRRRDPHPRVESNSLSQGAYAFIFEHT